MFSYQFYPNPDNFTPSRMVWMVTFSKSALGLHMPRVHPNQYLNGQLIELQKYMFFFFWNLCFALFIDSLMTNVYQIPATDEKGLGVRKKLTLLTWQRGKGGSAICWQWLAMANKGGREVQTHLNMDDIISEQSLMLSKLS